MSLPNYSPSGIIMFGSVPWNNAYTNVRLYGSLDEQYSDIASLMTINTGNYSYVARERRLKVSIEADKLYHCNYCMYRNESLTTGWIYCFISDVTYVNDNTSEVTLETDIFQTYLYNVDWSLPPCFVERETSADDSTFNPYVAEPDITLVYEVSNTRLYQFRMQGVIVMTAATPEKGFLENFQQLWNADAYYADPVDANIYYGVCNGAVYRYYDLEDLENNDLDNNPLLEDLRTMIKGLNCAGSSESILNIMSIPSFAIDTEKKEVLTSVHQDTFGSYQASFNAPPRGDSLNGYTPRNKKLLCYPYNYLRLSDYNGSETELRYEMLPDTGSDTDTLICIKYRVSPLCQAYVYPWYYAGSSGYYYGFPTNCGALGSWTSSSFQTWLAQNAGNIAVTAVSVALAAVTGGMSLGAAASATRGAQLATRALHGSAKQAKELAKRANKLNNFGKSTLIGAGLMTGAQIGSAYAAAHSPVTSRGNTNYNVTWMTGAQGVYADRMSLTPEIAAQLDDYFDQWGYAVEEVKAIEITSRPNWNFVKTGGAAPRSLNVAAGDNAPFTRGRGTPADVLAAIADCFDGGITFWHTTSGFGDYSLDNTV